MSEHRVPRRGGVPHNALVSLHQLGGVAVFSAWYEAAQTKLTPDQFNTQAVKVLVRHRLVDAGVGCVITAAGRTLLGIPPEKSNAVPPEIVPPRTAPPFRPLQRRSVSAIVYREGAFDYRDSPSVMGGERIPYRR